MDQILLTVYIPTILEVLVYPPIPLKNRPSVHCLPSIGLSSTRPFPSTILHDPRSNLAFAGAKGDIAFLIVVWYPSSAVKPGILQLSPERL